MATDQQIEANRRNAAKSTGPRTPEGKAISSLNALKTGVDVKSEVMRCETRAEYELLVAEYYAAFPPADPAERDLLDQVIKSAWLERRYMAVEAMVWEGGFEADKPQDIGVAFQRRQDTFVKIERLHNSAQRNYRRALAQLLALRKERGAKTPAREAAVPELASFDNLPDTPAITPPATPPADEEPPIAA